MILTLMLLPCKAALAIHDGKAEQEVYRMHPSSPEIVWNTQNEDCDNG